MKLKKYDSYLKEDKYEDEYFDEYGEYDGDGYEEEYEEEEESGDEDMEHLLYLLRTYLKDAGNKNVSVRDAGSSIKIEIVLNKRERLSDLIKTFATLKRLSNDIMADYDSEFDIWETKKGDPLLIIDYYSPEEFDDEDGGPF